ncbi:MAG: hypothetical protein S4CHLAM7_11450 [Chlamydiae bacterium]|nr:hypothetical protein [Chlamydiota bacterium]
MNTLKKIGLCLVLATAFFRASAANNEQTYTKNIYISLSSDSFLSGGTVYPNVGYFFGDNNQWSISATVLPYSQAVDKVDYKFGLDTKSTNWNVVIGAEIINYISIARKCFGNRMFVYYGPSWRQVFDVSKSTSTDGFTTKAVTKGDWEIDLSFGLQYRFNDHLYLGVDTPFFLYTQDKYENYTDGAYVSTVTDIDWYFFGGAATLNLIWKF